ncbi:MAG: bifunctional phosphoribosylaminoimidazolecarboxamide formyltransferase/IMP cyclohydrolase [bacterium]
MGEIGTALVSVYDRTGLDAFARRLAALGVRLVASGGTSAYLRAAGIECDDTSGITGRVELLGGLVKTLHPGIHAGILADRSNPAHMKELEALGYTKIDAVVVNFYALPEGPMRQDLSFIDIGGPAMARAAAKNFRSCLPVPHPDWYEIVASRLEAGRAIDLDLRWQLASDTVLRTGSYDADALRVLGLGLDAGPGAASMLVKLEKTLDLRYGENPHQRAGFYTSGGSGGFEVVKGELSYNNILDIDCCVEALIEFRNTAAVVVKHGGPCGMAEGDVGATVLERAYQCDPVSAYGGVVGVNFTFDRACADLLAKRFVECVVAPAFEPEALEVLAKKKSRLVTCRLDVARPARLRSAVAGVLVEERDALVLKDDLKLVSGAAPDEKVMDDLVFAWKAVKHVKSNAIVFAGQGRTLGIGAGQPSRVDSTRLAITKAAQFGHDLKGSVMASDGFFPFPDSVELAAQAGAQAVIQPGGSIRDGEVIEAAKRLGLTLALTSVRHFRH